MRNQTLTFGLIIVLVVSMLEVVCAADVTLSVSTYANYDVTANIVNPANEETIYSATQSSGEKGKAIFDFTTSANKLDVSVVVRKNGKIIVFKKLEGQSPNSLISVSALKEEVQQAQADVGNLTQDSSANTTNSSVSTSFPEENLTTNVSSQEIPQTSNNETQEVSSPPATSYPLLNWVMYIIGGVFALLVIIGLVLFFIFRKKVAPKGIKVKKYSEMKKERDDKGADDIKVDDKRLAELEDKINVLKEEIEGIRNRKAKIKEAEEKLKRDMEELEKLKKES